MNLKSWLLAIMQLVPCLAFPHGLRQSKSALSKPPAIGCKMVVPDLHSVAILQPWGVDRFIAAHSLVSNTSGHIVVLKYFLPPRLLLWDHRLM